MSKQIGLLTLLLTLLAVLAGCSTAGGFHTVNFGAGTMSVENGTFYMNGNVSVGTGAQPDIQLSNVSIVLYTEDGEIIKTVQLEPLSTDPDVAPLARHISIESKRPPEYVLIESPEFWNSNAKIQVYGYQRTENEYEEYFRSKATQKFPNQST